MFASLQARLLGPVDLSSYTAFCRFIGVKLTPWQTIVARVAYDGEEPRDVEGAAEFFGNVDTIPADARGVVNAVCGGRGGKTYTLGALRLVYGALTRDLAPMAPGQRAVALVIAPNGKLRQEAVNYALGAMRSHPQLEAMLRMPSGNKDTDTPSEFQLMRPDGKLVTFEAVVATSGGYGGRGRALTDLLLDEVAFFRDSSSKINDRDIYQAASARVLPGGQAILASTPWAEGGLLYEMHTENFGHPKGAIAVHAPTLALNDSAWVKTIVDREYARDPDNAAREFGARFMTGGTVLFFEASSIQAAVDDELELPQSPRGGDRVAAGADFGFRADSSALVVVHERLQGHAPVRHPGKLVVADVSELRPSDGSPLVPSETVSSFAGTLTAHGCTYVMADGHYREAITEHLVKHSLAYSPAPNTPADAYVRARTLFREGRVVLPNNPRLLQQLREVEGRPTPGGGMSITHPRWRQGGHGDLVAALVLALYQLGGDTIAAQRPDAGTPAWEAARKEERRRKAATAAELPYWRRPRGAQSR